MSTTTKCLKPLRDVRCRDLGDEYLFYDHEGDRLHVLNGSAREIFLLCDGTRTEDQVAQAFAGAYRETDRAEDDAREVIARLLELGILGLP